MQKYNYEEAISFFEKLPHFEPPKDTKTPKKNFFSLDAELALLKKLNDPQNDLKYVHVAGTNGKGSTIAYISSVLIESGLKVGTFASPFLYRYNELFKVNNKDISDEEFGRLFSKVKPAYDKLAAENIFPSEYEILTVMSFIYFKEMGCDIVVLEVSMGGRTDTTNVIPAPLVTVITPINYDHMSILGNTLTEIATEKAGIIKEDTVVVSAPQEPETQKVLERTCTEKHVSLEYTKAPLPIERSLKEQSFKLDRIYKTKLLGTYQIDNASTALLVIDKLREKGLSISDNAVDQGIAKTEWFGRFTVLRETPYVIVDGGHNRQGAAVLRSSLEEYFPGKKITFLLGILADKEVDIILDTLMPIAGKCYVAAVPNKRTMDPQILAGMIRSRGVEATVLGDDIPLENIINENDITCIMGSLYLIKKILGNAV